MRDPSRDDQQRRVPRSAVSAAIAFLVVDAVAVAACLSGLFTSSSYRPFVEIENTYRCLMAAELFFVAFLWPLWGRSGAVSVPVLGLLLAVSVPLVVISAYVADVTGAVLVRTHLLLIAVSAAAVAATRLIGRTRPEHIQYYYAIAAVLCGGLPLLQFLLLDLTGKGAPWLSFFSPFWAMELAQRDTADAARTYWAPTVLVFAGLAALMGALAKRRKA